VYQAIRDAARDRELGSTARRRLADFLSLIESFRAELDHLSPHELAEQVIERTGYRQVLKDEDSAEADARLGNIEELVGSIQDFETEATSRGEPATLSAYLERVSLVAGVDALKDAALVSLMTVHSAKGLEFNTVFLTGLEEDIFPYRGVGADQRDDEEEERRLAYVAVTRARQQLTITHVSQRSLFGRTRYLEPSRYLRDLPEEVVAHEGGGRLSYGSERPSSARFTNPTRREPERAPGERFIDTSAFDDVSDDSGRSLRPGTRVRHKSFGRGVVERVESGASQIVVARFADGVRRIHASFLELC
jgi:DNA helicase-2/ATP-dependent DNA helicase PcrA